MNGACTVINGPPKVRDVSIGVIAWNEEPSIGIALESLFQQSIFAHFKQLQRQCEIISLANGCTDATASIASALFNRQSSCHPFRDAFVCRSLDIRKRGKMNAWNLFVHEFSASEARYLFLMDGDIAIHHRDTLWNMYCTLENHPGGVISTDRPLKDILFKPKRSLRERVSVRASQMTHSSPAQLTGQLYCIRAGTARNIYLPEDLAACEDGFIKWLSCTDFLTRGFIPDRIVQAPHASHLFEAYTSVKDVFRNQKRQIIGQTFVHILIDDFLRKLPLLERQNMARTLRQMDRSQRGWLKLLMALHLKKARVFWRLFPGVLSNPFTRLRRIKGLRKIFYLPISAVSLLVACVSGWMAFRHLKKGSSEYWPDTQTTRLPGAEATPGLRRVPETIHNDVVSSATSCPR